MMVPPRHANLPRRAPRPLILALLAGLLTSLAWAGPGDLDTGFGSGGTFDLTPNPTIFFTTEGRAVAVQQDGKIVVAGSQFVLMINGTGLDVVVWRLNPDGTLDDTFGTGGAAVLPLPDAQQANAVALQPDGKIVVAGHLDADTARVFLVARFDTSGHPDTTFGGTGHVEFSFGIRVKGEASAVAVQRDGKIVVAGTSFSTIALARLNPDGSFDPTFGTNGRTAGSFTGANFDAQVTSMVIQRNQRIVVGGSASLGGGKLAFGLARFRTDGSPDPSFGTAATPGRVTTSFGSGRKDEIFALALQQDGRIVAAGSTRVGTGPADFALARYRTNGTLDLTFGGTGKATRSFAPGSDDVARAVAVQGNGRIVVAGSVAALSQQHGVVMRLLKNGHVDPGFDSGIPPVIGPPTTDVSQALALQKDGKIVTAGFLEVGGNETLRVRRYAAK